LIFSHVILNKMGVKFMKFKMMFKWDQFWIEAE